jgi:hypothetical protein
VENYILNLKREHPSWGARKIRERLTRRFSDIKIPAKSTVHALLDRHGFVERRGRARRRALLFVFTPYRTRRRASKLPCVKNSSSSLPKYELQGPQTQSSVRLFAPVNAKPGALGRLMGRAPYQIGGYLNYRPDYYKSNCWLRAESAHIFTNEKTLRTLPLVAAKRWSFAVLMMVKSSSGYEVRVVVF